MKFYSRGPLDDQLDSMRKRIDAEIKNETDAYILNVNVDDYCNALKHKYILDIPEIHLSQVTAEAIEKDVPGSKFPGIEFNIVDPNKMIRVEAILFHIPYTGNLELLEYSPNRRVLRSAEFEVDTRTNCIIIEVINFYKDPLRIKSSFEDASRNLQSNYHGIIEECKIFNSSLHNQIKQLVENRKSVLLKRNDTLSALGIPLKTREDTPKTFSVPSPRLREKIIVKPIVNEKSYQPEPTLDANSFKKICKIIFDVGRNLERMPSIYKGKSEEDIRDHIIMVLDPNFEYGSASGETFNKTGRTDILLKHDSSVVFVAECKYWKGESSFLKTIDQLLGYLTWRDSKVSVINFVRTAEFTGILDKIKSSIQTHPNYLGYLGESEESWFNYRFHINGDRNREIELAIISFHLPNLS